MERHWQHHATIQIHDHFDGSANCVQCDGECRLTGSDRTLTELVRWMIEGEIYRRDGFIDSMELDTLRKAGVDVVAARVRAKESRAPNQLPLIERRRKTPTRS